MNQIERYLKPTPTIDSDNKSIKQKALDLTKGKKQAKDKAKSLFYFVRDEIKFIPHLPIGHLESYLASKILEIGGGMCIQKAVLLATLTRAAGIPALVHFIDIRNYRVPDKIKEVLETDLFPYHGYNELFIEGKWVKATPTFELKVCQENRLFPVEFDGKHDAMLPSHDLDGNPHIEYLQDHGHYDNIPLDEIYDAWTKAYGIESREGLNQLIEAQEAQMKGPGDSIK